MKKNWEDITVYSRRDKIRMPAIWHHIIWHHILRYDGGYMTISVHRHIDFPKDVWLLSCQPFFVKYQLKNKNINKAKREALRKVKFKLKSAINAFKKEKP